MLLVLIAWIQWSLHKLHLRLKVRVLSRLLLIEKVKTRNNPGLVVMGRDSHYEGRGFEYRRHILDGHDIFYIDLL